MPRGKPPQKVVNEFDEPIPDSEQPWTWELRATEHAKAITMTMRCCLCGQALVRKNNGWCAHCQRWPINVTPRRRCERDHGVSPDGWCQGCNDYVLTAMEPRDGQWIDAGIVPNRIAKEKIKALVAEIAANLSRPGWPEVEVPLRRDMIPRKWKHATLRKVGLTSMGHEVVIPESTAPLTPKGDPDDRPAGDSGPSAGTPSDEVPF